LVEYDTQDKHPNGVLKGGWYIGPRETLKESVLGPLPYVVQGRQVWLATLSVPIIADGRFLGVAGTDYDLDFVQRISQEVSAKLFEGQGEVAIVSDQGLIVAESRYPNLIGQHFQQVQPDAWRPALDSIQKGERLARLDDNGMMIVLAPIHLGRTGKPWSMMLKIDKQIVLAKATEQGRDGCAEPTKHAAAGRRRGRHIAARSDCAMALGKRDCPAHPQSCTTGWCDPERRLLAAPGTSLR